MKIIVIGSPFMTLDGIMLKNYKRKQFRCNAIAGYSPLILLQKKTTFWELYELLSKY